MLEILSLIRSDGDPRWCRSVPNWDRAPWFETVLGGLRAQRNARPRLISSHLPVQLFATRYFRSQAKVGGAGGGMGGNGGDGGQGGLMGGG